VADVVRPGPQARGIAAILAGYVVIALHIFRRATIDGYRDTFEYRALARRPLISADFWLGVRPSGYPLLIRAFDAYTDRPAYLLWAQLILYIGSFALVAWGLARRCEKLWVRLACFATVLLGSLSAGLLEWTHAYSTESVSISLMLLPIGFVLLSVPDPPRSRALRVAFIVVSVPVLFVWVATRDVDATWLLLATIGAAVFTYVLRAPAPARRGALAAVAVAGVLVVLSGMSVDVGKRWRYPLVNVIGQRVLTDPERKARFMRDGMPDNAKVECFRGRWGIDCNSDFTGFEPWLTTHGKQTYTHELLTHPLHTLFDPFSQGEALLCGNRIDIPASPTLEWYSRVKKSDLHKMLSLVFVADGGWLVGELLVCAILLGLVIYRRRLRVDATTAPLIVLAATVWPMLVVIWHGDSMEIQRHALVPIVCLRVALWGTFFLCIDRLVGARQRSST
jgi:hypothetical protein